jgi:hypothetical protein
MPRPSYEQVRSLLRKRVRLVTTQSVSRRFARAWRRAMLAVRCVAREVLAVARRVADWSAQAYGPS